MEMNEWNYKIDIKLDLKVEFPKSMSFDDVESEIYSYLEEFKVFLEDQEIKNKKVFLTDLEEEIYK